MAKLSIDLEGPTKGYQSIVANDRVKPPADMCTHQLNLLGTQPISAAEYIDPAFHRLEMDKMWSKVWQIACREEEIPGVGDMMPYEIGSKSVMVVRSGEDEIKAFPNACLHRGTKLCTAPRKGAGLIRCPFHGVTWNIDGRLAQLPSRWDYPQLGDDDFDLPELQVARWGGFVFINFDPDAIPLEQYFGQMFTQLSSEHFENLYIAGHYIKILPCNWKAGIEAFIESYHVWETHPQVSLFGDPWLNQYDVFPDEPHFNRTLEPQAVTPRQRPSMTAQQQVDRMYKVVGAGEAPKVPDGMNAREFIAQTRRDYLSTATGRDMSQVSDAEFLDSLQYLAFPNVVLFRGYMAPVVYRFRPNGDDPDTCIYDLYIMEPTSANEPRPPAAKTVDIGDRSFADADPLPKWFGHLFDQDTENLGLQQQGLKSLQSGQMTLTERQEVRIRHLHRTLHSYVYDNPTR